MQEKYNGKSLKLVRLTIHNKMLTYSIEIDQSGENKTYLEEAGIHVNLSGP